MTELNSLVIMSRTLVPNTRKCELPKCGETIHETEEFFQNWKFYTKEKYPGPGCSKAD